MLSDTDRHIQYYHAISEAIAAFRSIEGRKPVVLDAGVGTGFLTACALHAGVEQVIAVDVDAVHVQKLPERIHPYEQHVVAMTAAQYHATPIAFDMLVSELLGTFSNSESAFLYLGQYAQHMKVHKSGIVYSVPQRVVQTVRPCGLTQVPLTVGRALRRGYVPTNFVGYLYQLESPPTAASIVVRVDDFRTYPFQCELPQKMLAKDTYVAEWVATLWGSRRLSNTWEWARTYRGDFHSVTARAHAWGLMLFTLSSPRNVNANARRKGAVNSTVPDISGRMIVIDDGIADDALFHNRPDAVEDVNKLSAIAERLPSTPTGVYNPNRVVRKRRPRVNGFISMQYLWHDLPSDFQQMLYQTTIVPVVEALHSVFPLWNFTTGQFPSLPFLYSENATDPRDVPVELIPPLDATMTQWLVVGALFRLP